MPAPEKTPEEIEEFMELDPIEFDESKHEQAYKTNLYLFDKNFISLGLYLNNVVSFVQYFYSLVDVSSLVQSVFDLVSTNKAKIPILSATAIEAFTLTTIGTKIYRLTRNDAFTVTITLEGNPAWNVDALIVQVKRIDGVIIYPTITTFENKIVVNFHDGIIVNYNLFFL